jgi:hypothetical protein
MIPVKYKTQQKDRKKKETSMTGSEIYKSDNNLPPPHEQNPSHKHAEQPDRYPIPLLRAFFFPFLAEIPCNT